MRNILTFLFCGWSAYALAGYTVEFYQKGKSLHNHASSCADFGSVHWMVHRSGWYSNRGKRLIGNMCRIVYARRDNYANLVEEHPDDPRLNLYNRFETDMLDLACRSKHIPDKTIGTITIIAMESRLLYNQLPKGSSALAFDRWRTEVLQTICALVDRSSSNFQRWTGRRALGWWWSTNCWPGAVLMGCEPDKIIMQY